MLHGSMKLKQIVISGLCVTNFQMIVTSCGIRRSLLTSFYVLSHSSADDTDLQNHITYYL
jgi:hypothetical protein